MDEILRHYDRYDEASRLAEPIGALELARTQEIVLRHLPAPPAVVADVGGGPGVYSLWLAALGYEVHLVDLVPKHVEQARQASAKQPQHSIASIRLGDARELLLVLARRTENEPSLAGMSPHLLAVAARA